MAGISSLGVGSGLDLASLLDSLQAAEETKLTQIENQQTSYQTRISAFGTLQTSLESLQAAAEALASSDTLTSVTGATTGDAFSIAAEAGAVPGTYDISVQQLATAERLQSAAFADRTAQQGTGGTLEITVSGKTVQIELDDDTSLDGVAKAINNNDDAGVYATIINDGTGNAYLMLTSQTEGEAGAINAIAVSGNDTLAGALAYTADGGGAFTVQQAAQDAQLTVNGIAITSASNTVTQAIDGVTLTLTATTQGGTQRATVSRDTDASIEAVKAFVKAYNSLQTTISGLTAFDVEAETQAALTGNAAVRGIQNAVAAALRVSTSEGALRTLSQMGITTDPSTGQLALDEDTLGKALINNPADVVRLFSGEGGLAQSMSSTLSGILDENGSIQTSIDGLERTLKTLNDTYDRTQASIDATMEIYRAQFTQLDVLMAQLNQTSEYLTQQFNAMSSSSSSS